MSNVFSTAFVSDLIETIAFNPAWKNETGYLDHAAQSQNAPVVPAGKTVKSTDDSGRKILIVGTEFGNFVMFQRYTGDDSVVVSNANIKVRQESNVANGAMSEEDIIKMLDKGGVTITIKEVPVACAPEQEKAAKSSIDWKGVSKKFAIGVGIIAFGYGGRLAYKRFFG